MRRVLAAISLLLAATTANADRPTVYRLEIVLDPPTGSIEVRGEVGVTLSTVGPRVLPLRLHEGFEVRRVSLDGQPLEVTTVPAEATRLQPATQLVKIHLPATVEDPEIQLQVEYGGHLNRLPQFGTPAAEGEDRFLDDTIDAERVELAWYSAWYLQLGDFGQTFEADLLVALPKGWTLVGLGEPSPPTQSGSRTRVRWSAKAIQDLVLIASPDFEVVRVQQDDGTVEIYSSRLPRPFVKRQAEEIRTALELFEQTLGRAEGTSATVRLVYSPRKAGQGGYSRAPLIVASEGVVLDGLAEGEVTSMLGGLAHEAAHFWWHFGVGQGDWMNETFAEYFARFAVERILGEERPLARAQRAVSRLPDDAPPLAEVPADNSGDGYTIRYFKGSLMLDALRTALGDEAFFALCREFYLAFRGRRIGTREFHSFWQPRLGEHAALLDLWLDSPGAVPASTGPKAEL
jgi:aminopeptidase N